jgi:hypothetical protein
MSQRTSGYERQPLDDYQTREPWVTQALLPVLAELMPLRGLPVIWEPAAGQGFMVKQLRKAGYTVHSTDIHKRGGDFLKATQLPAARIDAIVTNPPYSHARQFIEQALVLLEQSTAASTAVCMLLRCDYDSARTRQHLFGHCGRFHCKLVLTKRINWFEHRIASPSYNHAWFVWWSEHMSWPTIRYTP